LIIVYSLGPANATLMESENPFLEVLPRCFGQTNSEELLFKQSQELCEMESTSCQWAQV
jgi:hypothetical protein